MQSIRRFIDGVDFIEEIHPAIREELLALAEEHWPWLVERLSAPTRQ
jgi:hypothetical protein